jgi:hypothetical protein
VRRYCKTALRPFAGQKNLELKFLKVQMPLPGQLFIFRAEKLSANPQKDVFAC